MRTNVALLLVVLAGCGQLEGPINDAANGNPMPGLGGGGGEGGDEKQDHRALGFVEAVIDGESRTFEFSTGGVTPYDYTTFVAHTGDYGQTLQISFAGRFPGEYECGSSQHTKIEYDLDSMTAASGHCTIVVTQVGRLGEPIRGTFSARLAGPGGQVIAIDDGAFDVPNEIP